MNRAQQSDNAQAQPERTGTGGTPEFERLMEEINILRLEGALFCFDPKEAKRRRGTLSLEALHGEFGKRPVTIKLDAECGQPSVLAYKVMQAIFLKLAEQGCSPTEDGRCFYRDTVSFTWRELARLTGRTWGTSTSQQLFTAVTQLQRTLITCSFYDKATGCWEALQFYVLPSVRYAGKDNEIRLCSFTIDRAIINSINNRHFAFFNLQRLYALDTIGVVLYKRIFFHFSNLNQEKTKQHTLRFEKDYENICYEWLGGLKPELYRSLIISNQLGRHLEGLKRTRLIRRYDIVPKASGQGFKLVFYPGEGFFDDYRDYYLRAQQPRVALPETPELREIQQPLELVAHFHQLLGHEQQRFEEKEVAYASELLTSLSEAEVRDLIEYAVEAAGKTNFPMRWFGALKLHLEPWAADRSRRRARKEKAAAVAACSYCDERGHIFLRNREGAFAAMPCPHDIVRITALEEERGLRRI